MANGEEEMEELTTKVVFWTGVKEAYSDVRPTKDGQPYLRTTMKRASRHTTELMLRVAAPTCVQRWDGRVRAHAPTCVKGWSGRDGIRGCSCWTGRQPCLPTMMVGWPKGLF